MTAPPKRRWFRFSLRTLFVVVTLAAVPLGWIGYSVNWIRQRRSALAASGPAAGWTPHADGWEIIQVLPEAQPPGLLWLFGEQGVNRIYINHGPSDKEVTHLKSLFPEATILDQRNQWSASVAGSLTAPTP